MTKTKVRITALNNIERKYSVNFMGIKVAVAFDRDSGAKVGYDAIMIEGDIGSCGSRIHWVCYVCEGSIFELAVDTEFYNKNKNRIKNWKIEEIEEFSMTKQRSIELQKMEDNLE